MRGPNFGRAILAGIAAWVVFIIVLSVIPLVGVPKMDLPGMLGGMFGLNGVAIGWAILFVVGIVFALLYAYWWVNHLPGPGWQRGLIFGILPWLVMMVIVAPVLPKLNPMVARTPPGFFFANMGMIATIGSLIAHLIWGMVLGAVYGNVAARPRASEVSEVPEISTEWMWRVILSGGVVFHGQRRLFRLIPGTQRCKNCLAPLGGSGAVLMRLLGRGPFHRNPRFCNF